MPTPEHKNHSLIPSQVGDVFKLFSNECRYLIAPTEAIRRSFKVFENACSLCGVDTSSKEIMIHLHQTTFLEDPTLIYFIETVVRISKNPEDVIKQLESHFLDDRAK